MLQSVKTAEENRLLASTAVRHHSYSKNLKMRPSRKINHVGLRDLKMEALRSAGHKYDNEEVS